jgi:GNAT superfamily N-acetyltransferase
MDKTRGFGRRRKEGKVTEKEEASAVRYVRALPSMAPLLAGMWKRLIDEETPPLIEAGDQGEEDSRRAFSQMLADPDRCTAFVAFADGEPAGFIMGYVYSRPYGVPTRAGQILHWYVDPPSRGSGIGRALYGRLTDWFEKEKVEIV